MEAQARINQDFQSIYSQTSEVTKSITDTADKGIAIKQDIERQKMLDDEAAINVGKELAKALGADPNAANYRMKALAEQKAAATDEAIKLTGEYEKLSAVSFLDNPIEWFLNQFQKDAVAEQANAATNKSLLATQELMDINNEIQQGVLTSKIVSETVNQDLTAKKLELSAIANKQAADQLKLDALSKNSDALKAVMTGNNAIMSAAQHQDSVILQQQHMAQAERHFQVSTAMAKDRFNLELEQFEEMKKQREISNDFKQQSMDFAMSKWDAKQEADANKLVLDLEDRMNKAEKAGKKDEAKALRDQLTQAKKEFEMNKAIAIQQGKQDFVARYKQVVSAIGADNMIVIPDNIYDAEKVINDGKKLADNPKDAYGRAWKAVRDSMASVIAQTKVDSSKHPVIALGFTPSEAIGNLQLLNTKLDPAQERTANAVASRIQYEIKQLKTDNPNISDKELRAEVDYRVANHFAEAMKNPESSDLTKLPKPAELANFSVAKKGGKFFTKYIAPKIEEGNTDTSFDEIGALAAKALSNKEVNFNELASELSQMYSEAVAYNNAKQGYSRFGIPMMNKYLIYGAGERVLDLTNPTDIKTALIFKSMQSNPFEKLYRAAAPAVFDWMMERNVNKFNPEDVNRR